jgi:glycosidase
VNRLLLALALLFSGPARAALPAAPAQESVPADTRAVTFRFAPEGAAQSVAVVGTFNRWDRTTNPLARQPDGKTWSATLRLEPGVYQYRFVVNGARWLADPNAPGMDDGNGNINSVLTVLPHGYETRPGVIGDGLITGSAVRHRPMRPYVLRMDRTHFALTLRTRHNDVKRCWLDVRGQKIPMTRSGSDALFDYWRATATLPAQGPLRYAFRLEDGPNPRLYDAGDWLVAGSFAPKWFMLNPKEFPTLTPPDWPRDAVFYQIFPDRFADGDTANDPPDVQPWGSKPTAQNWMGGDLAGVIRHLDYLRALGVNALYFNPLFAARSNHGYDTTDYHQVDPRFGTNETLKALVTKAHALGWHVILDGVFNHTGVDFFAFRSLREQGAQSPYRDWYFVKGFPIEAKEGQTNYVAWFGVPWLPKINTANPATRAYLLDVATRWIRQAGIDGWRLDAADEVSQDYWRAFHKAVRAVRPDAYILGEMWGDAGPWLQGDQWDAVMNYRWRAAALDFFVFDRLPPTQFDARLTKLRDDYPPAATAVMFNLLGSHDTERLRTLCRGDRARETQAALFQMTYPGTPCVYYGDEIGMEGGHDPDDRRAMEWDEAKWDRPMLATYQRLIALRRRSPVLRRGDYRTVLADDRRGLFGFTRALGPDRALVLFNRSAIRR